MDTVIHLARPFRLLAPLIGAAALVLATVSPALGHAELTGSDPADKAVLATPPTSITLTFSAGLDAGKSSFKVIGPGGGIGTATPAKDGDTVMILAGIELAPGAYSIEWTSVAEDGDIERGTLSFTVAAATPVPATPTPEPSTAASASPSPEASAVPSAVPAGTPSPSQSALPGSPAASSGDVVLPIVAALVLVAVIGALVLRRTRAA